MCEKPLHFDKFRLIQVICNVCDFGRDQDGNPIMADTGVACVSIAVLSIYNKMSHSQGGFCQGHVDTGSPMQC